MKINKKVEKIIDRVMDVFIYTVVAGFACLCRDPIYRVQLTNIGLDANKYITRKERRYQQKTRPLQSKQYVCFYAERIDAE